MLLPSHQNEDERQDDFEDTTQRTVEAIDSKLPKFFDQIRCCGAAGSYSNLT